MTVVSIILLAQLMRQCRRATTILAAMGAIVCKISRFVYSVIPFIFPLSSYTAHEPLFPFGFSIILDSAVGMA